jgi:thiol-disulfide isomerase/thioredoxin
MLHPKFLQPGVFFCCFSQVRASINRIALSLSIGMCMASQLLGCASVSLEAAALVGHPVPDGRLMLLTGEDRALKDSRGRNKAILFWATWCTHSRSVIAQFEDIAREYAARGDTEFFAVNLDRNEHLDVVRGRISAQDLTTVTHVFSGNDVQDEAFLALKGDQVPYSVFIDARSIVRYVGVGVGGLAGFLETRLSERAQSGIQSETFEQSELQP